MIYFFAASKSISPPYQSGFSLLLPLDFPSLCSSLPLFLSFPFYFLPLFFFPFLPSFLPPSHADSEGM